MNTRLLASALAAIGGATALLAPGTSQAANVGTYGSCFGGSKATAITAAGHTPVAVGTLDAASLNGLGALIVENCNSADLSGKINAAVTSAVFGGMLLVVNDWNSNANTSSALPGTPAVTWQQAFGADINLVAGMPFISGAGGTLTDTSLDGGNHSHHGITTSAMPVGVTALLTTGSASQTVGIRYAHGSGAVVYNGIPMDAYLPGGGLNAIAAGTQTYLTNILSNSNLVSTTCASEGYTYTKLEWCKNICERGYTGATLDMWIRRWVNRYRDLPYCAREEEPEVPQQEA